MAKVYVFFADGMEEIEAVTPVDLLRRAGHEVVTVSVMGRREIRGAHNMQILADEVLAGQDCADGDLLVLPGGGEGTENLGACEPLRRILMDRFVDGKKLAAICAAPSVFGGMGLLKGRKAVVYPGMEDTLIGAQPQDVSAVTDGQITTGRGPGAALAFALELIRVMDGAEKAEEILGQVVYVGGDTAEG